MFVYALELHYNTGFQSPLEEGKNWAELKQPPAPYRGAAE